MLSSINSPSDFYKVIYFLSPLNFKLIPLMDLMNGKLPLYNIKLILILFHLCVVFIWYVVSIKSLNISDFIYFSWKFYICFYMINIWSSMLFPKLLQMFYNFLLSQVFFILVFFNLWFIFFLLFRCSLLLLFYWKTAFAINIFKWYLMDLHIVMDFY